MAKDLAYYVKKFSPKKKIVNPTGLNVSRSKGIAPNKPILLLSIIELISQGELIKNQIPLSAELVATFLKLWSYLVPERKPDIGQPFFYLKSDGFWHFWLKPEYSSEIKPRTSSIRENLEYAHLDPELWQLLQNPQERSILTRTLIDSWFKERTQDIEPLLQVNAFAELQEQLRSQGGKVYKPEELELEDEQQKIVRDGAFRKIVIATYNYTCAFCGLQILDTKGQNIVDGAHIKPFSRFYDDRIDNGLSLCKNHHWAFDRGWFTIDDDYRIIVASDLREQSPNARPMRDMAGVRILLPSQQQYYPRLDALRWHRENMFDAA